MLQASLAAPPPPQQALDGFDVTARMAAPEPFGAELDTVLAQGQGCGKPSNWRAIYIARKRSSWPAGQQGCGWWQPLPALAWAMPLCRLKISCHRPIAAKAGCVCRRRPGLTATRPQANGSGSAHRTHSQLDDKQPLFRGPVGKHSRSGGGRLRSRATPAVVGACGGGTGLRGGCGWRPIPPCLVRTAAERWGSQPTQPALARRGDGSPEATAWMLNPLGAGCWRLQGAPVSHGPGGSRPWRHQEREPAAAHRCPGNASSTTPARLAARLASGSHAPGERPRKCCSAPGAGACEPGGGRRRLPQRVSERHSAAKRRELRSSWPCSGSPTLAGAEPSSWRCLGGARRTAPGDRRPAWWTRPGCSSRTPVAAWRAAPPCRPGAGAGLLLYGHESDPDARDDFLHGYSLRIKRQRWLLADHNPRAGQ